MQISSSRLVFVAGLHRSGTSPLARLLAGHPEVSGFSDTGEQEDEGQHLQHVYPRARERGGAGRFAFARAAHLTEGSPLASPDNAQRLLAAWIPHWDLSRPVLVEKSPPNLIMTRFLQALFPDARFVAVIRHPVVVALSTQKWAVRTPLTRLVQHWLHAHELFLEDAPRLRHLHVLSYEDLVADPAATLGRVGRALGLHGDIQHDAVDRGRSTRYELQWSRMRASHNPLDRLAVRHVAALEPRIRRFGYTIEDLSVAAGFPPVVPAVP